jgi:hypothetical protein
VGGVRVIQLGDRGRRGRAGVVGARGDRDPVLAEHAADLPGPESCLVDVDIVDDQESRRLSSAAAKNAEAVLRISFARRSSAFSRLSRLTSADSAVDSGDGELDPPRSSSAGSPGSRPAVTRRGCERRPWSTAHPPGARGTSGPPARGSRRRTFMVLPWVPVFLARSEPSEQSREGQDRQTRQARLATVIGPLQPIRPDCLSRH